MPFHRLVLSALGKRMGVEQTVQPDNQLPTLAYIVHAQVCGPKVNLIYCSYCHHKL